MDEHGLDIPEMPFREPRSALRPGLPIPRTAHLHGFADLPAGKEPRSYAGLYRCVELAFKRAEDDLAGTGDEQVNFA
ncbi:hypothetical protein [Rhizobium yanglingense]